MFFFLHSSGLRPILFPPVSVPNYSNYVSSSFSQVCAGFLCLAGLSFFLRPLYFGIQALFFFLSPRGYTSATEPYWSRHHLPATLLHDGHGDCAIIDSGLHFSLCARTASKAMILLVPVCKGSAHFCAVTFPLLIFPYEESFWLAAVYLIL